MPPRLKTKQVVNENIALSDEWGILFFSSIGMIISVLNNNFPVVRK
jgi:hypothetical protein